MDKLIAIANSLLAVAQNGLHFTQDPFDKLRYEEIKQLGASILSEKSSLSTEEVLDLFAKEQGYATPKIDVRAAVFQGDKILMVREITDGLWSLPGGYVDINQSPSEAICKEIWEESGFKAKAVKLMAVYDKNKHHHPVQLPHIFKLFFMCEITGGEKTPSIETSEVDFFSLDNLPPLSVRRVTKFQIERAYVHKGDMELATEFD